MKRKATEEADRAGKRWEEGEFSKLHEPQAMVGRVAEMQSIRRFVFRCLDQDAGGALYVCGVSGTGKSEAVHQIYDGLEHAKLVEQILWLTGTKTGFSLAKELGIKVKDLSKALSSKSAPLVVVVVDEMDLLPKQEFRKLFALASSRESRLVLVGIANTVNVHTLLGSTACQEVAFFPYDAPQLLAIARTKLLPHVLSRFRPEALDMCARKAALRSGDLRHLMSICDQVFQHSETHGIGSIGVGDVGKALWSLGVAPQVDALAAQSKFALVALALASRRHHRGRREDGEGEEDGGVAFDAVDLETIRPEWAKLRQVWDVPTEGAVDQYLDYLVDLGLVQRDKHKGKFHIQVSHEDILQGLLGRQFSTDSEEGKQQAMHRPLVLAFRNLKRRVLFNLHQVEE
ncbi:hypothetical protein BASA81_007966 [Batrachochytrium salamandrivorans]|nr:hypothetical protein BASA81_007966 [Batrachochytrium salamandrivorans]